MTITIRSPIGGFVAILPVAGCRDCPWFKPGEWAKHDKCTRAGRPVYGEANLSKSSTIPGWCPAMAEAQNELPGTADMDFLLNDAIASLQNKSEHANE